eukprot:m.37735 g.37735  ORF g.37735 m.37735 type:complete len:337 (+) comp9344_c0_seq1:193-1203(+)
MLTHLVFCAALAHIVGGSAMDEIISKIKGSIPGADMEKILREGNTKLISPEFKCSDKFNDEQGFSRSMFFPEEYDGLVDVNDNDSMTNILRGTFELLDKGLDGLGAMTGDGGNGELSREELANRVFGALTGWTDLSNDEWVNLLDKDYDGLVTLEELLRDEKGDANHRTFLELRFKAADGNNDGWLGDRDVQKFLNPIWYESMLPWLSQQYIHLLDADRNFEVSRSEFEALTKPLSTLEYIQMPTLSKDAVDSLFSKYDEDKSGSLSAGEMFNFISKESVKALVSAKVDCIFQKLDEDSSDSLTVDELSARPSIVVGTVVKAVRVPEEELELRDEL